MTFLEVLGVAGSGKSTLAGRLVETDERLVAGEFIHARIPSHLWHIIRGFPGFWRPFVDGLLKAPRPTWADFKLMAYITEWGRYLGGRPEYEDRVVVMDQGPIYSLVRLRAKGLALNDSDAFDRWWEDCFEDWAQLLRGVVWLDASDPTLVQRIETRAQSHVVKGGPEQAAREFISRYRDEFEGVLPELEARGVEVLQFDTGQISPETIVDAVIARVGDWR